MTENTAPVEGCSGITSNRIRVDLSNLYQVDFAEWFGIDITVNMADADLAWLILGHRESEWKEIRKIRTNPPGCIQYMLTGLTVAGINYVYNEKIDGAHLMEVGN